ncbi:protein translocase subunit SecF [Protaetiibacter sp. SSC-01]|uniref:protein translocase subunit SecF n=1 Tax=Protaetiibacter sp. SSC-01 TaxID=2759943 RepID=UPI001656E8D9|nr:protein translocase subunit SecF [Protaetiibacter sp. SSC-01]QNO36405.1 protein translocase subunit SecF [Protaetiibacter sp. SSC-01]
MAGPFQRLGNDLYTGARSVDFVGKRRIWFAIAAILMIASVAVPFVRGGGDFLNGFNFGIEFRGGSQFLVSEIPAENRDPIDITLAEDAVHEVVPEAVVRVSTVGDSGVRVQTDQLNDTETRDVTANLEEAYATDSVSASFIGATWGEDITQSALRALLVFLVLALVFMALYFRTWKMSIAAILKLLHDLIISVGIYAATGWEITPAAVIGFLTILGYSLYDTVVVFDKIRENTAELGDDSSRTFGEAVNLAVNQTLVRSINTGVVAALPVAAILFIGAFVLGADTLRDISLALLVGTIAGTYSTPAFGAPLYSVFREREPEIAKRDKRVLQRRGELQAA